MGKKKLFWEPLFVRKVLAKMPFRLLMSKNSSQSLINIFQKGSRKRHFLTQTDSAFGLVKIAFYYPPPALVNKTPCLEHVQDKLMRVFKDMEQRFIVISTSNKKSFFGPLSLKKWSKKCIIFTHPSTN